MGKEEREMDTEEALIAVGVPPELDRAYRRRRKLS
jgi:hypothetical protein